MKQSLDIDQIQVFNKVVQAGSFTKAAAILKYPKSRVSRQVAALESSLGTQLIYRTTRQFQLTAAGRELFEKSFDLIERLNGALEEVAGNYSSKTEGLIRLSAPEDIGVEVLNGLCLDFMNKFPLVEIELVLSDQVVDLVKDSFDLAVRLGHLKDSSLLTRKIGSISFLLVASREYIGKEGEIKRFDQVEDHPFLKFSGISSKSEVVAYKGEQVHTVSPKTIFTSNNIFAIREFALASKGFALLPEFMVRDHLERGDLLQVLKSFSFHSSPIQLVMPPQREGIARVKRLSDHLFTNLKVWFS